LLSTDGFDTVDVAPPIMSSTENNTQGARRDEQRTRFLSRENIATLLQHRIICCSLQTMARMVTSCINIFEHPFVFNGWSGIDDDRCNTNTIRQVRMLDAIAP